MKPATRFNRLQADTIETPAGKTFPSGTQHAHVADAAKTASAAGAATVATPTAITAASTDTTAASLTTVQALRVEVVALIADLAALRTEFNKGVTDLGNHDTKINSIFDSLEAFKINALS